MVAPLDIEETLSRLDTDERITLLAGSDLWHLSDNQSAGIPRIRVSDGPNGVRGARLFDSCPASCFPSPTGMASSFDIELLYAIGEQIARECRAKGVHVLLAPTVNIQRSPTAGRGFESYSEDPALSGHLAAAFIKGVQSQEVAATIKHYVMNDQETHRHSSDSIADERAMREIYLEPFRIAQVSASPSSYMTAYNRVNGTHVSESTHLLQEILRREWGFKGLIMSDWGGVYSTAPALKAGLDLEMPGPTTMRGGCLTRTLMAGTTTSEEIEVSVRRILELVNDGIRSGIPFNKDEEAIDTPDTRRLLRSAAADAVVLLKNDDKLLPLGRSSFPKHKKLAIIGANADRAIISGGGSAALTATYKISPRHALTKAAADIGVDAAFAIGDDAYHICPVLESRISCKGQTGMLVECFSDSPSEAFLEGTSHISREPEWTITLPQTSAFMIDGVPPAVSGRALVIRATTDYTPETSGTYAFGIATGGRGRLYVDGRLVVDNTDGWRKGGHFFGNCSAEQRGLADLEGGRVYRLELRIERGRYSSSDLSPGAAFHLGATRLLPESSGIQEAVNVAREADVAVCVVGLNNDFESEGYDRKDMDLPGRTNELVRAVLRANPRTVVVNQSGTPVAMPWADDAKTVLQAFYGGNEVGSGIADVLFGRVNPASKLPLTFPRQFSDNPAFLSFGEFLTTPKKVPYVESIFVGYRHYDQKKLAPLFPFGHGLSYTDFAYSDLRAPSYLNSPEGEIRFRIKNVGHVEGREIAQIYIAPLSPRLIRPPKELKGFAKTRLLKAGGHQELSIRLGKEAFSCWDPRPDADSGTWVAEKGTYEILVAASSTDIRLRTRVELRETLEWRGL